MEDRYVLVEYDANNDKRIVVVYSWADLAMTHRDALRATGRRADVIAAPYVTMIGARSVASAAAVMAR